MPEIEDPRLKTLAALHDLTASAQRMIDNIDQKVEGIHDTTIEVNVEALRTIRMILFAQRYALQQLVEHQAEMDDIVEQTLAKLNKKL